MVIASIVIVKESLENFGAYFLSKSISANQRAKTISTIILKAKAFPVIKGKKRPLTTYRQINGVIKIRNKLIPRKIFVVMEVILAQDTRKCYISSII